MYFPLLALRQPLLNPNCKPFIVLQVWQQGHELRVGPPLQHSHLGLCSPEQLKGSDLNDDLDEAHLINIFNHLLFKKHLLVKCSERREL